MIIWHYHHIVPKHIGGDDSSENLLKCNVAMHYFLHKQLYERFGRWQDYIAYKGLKGEIGNDELKKISLSQGGKRGSSNSICIENRYQKGCNNFHARKIKLTDPNGNDYITHGNLKEFCNNHNLSYMLIYKAAWEGGKTIPAISSKATRISDIERRNNTTGWFVQYV